MDNPENSYFQMTFHHEGVFKPNTVIEKGNNFGRVSSLRIDDEGIEVVRRIFVSNSPLFDEHVPQQEIFPNGLSREQIIKVLAAQKTVVDFNGGYPNEQSLESNFKMYEGQEDTSVNLSEFYNKGSISCAESAIITQQILAPTETVTYISGAADLTNTGEMQMHSFNLIKPADPQYAMAILDLANPIYLANPDGKTQAKVYCAPITSAQWETFKSGKEVEVEYAGVVRKYKFGMASGFVQLW